MPEPGVVTVEGWYFGKVGDNPKKHSCDPAPGTTCIVGHLKGHPNPNVKPNVAHYSSPIIREDGGDFFTDSGTRYVLTEVEIHPGYCAGLRKKGLLQEGESHKKAVVRLFRQAVAAQVIILNFAPKADEDAIEDVLGDVLGLLAHAPGEGPPQRPAKKPTGTKRPLPPPATTTGGNPITAAATDLNAPVLTTSRSRTTSKDKTNLGWWISWFWLGPLWAGPKDGRPKPPKPKKVLPQPAATTTTSSATGTTSPASSGKEGTPAKGRILVGLKAEAVERGLLDPDGKPKPK